MAQTLGPELFEQLRRFLSNRGYAFETRPYQVFLAKGRGAVVSLYTNGKVVISGSAPSESAEVARFVESIGGTPAPPETRVSPGVELENLRGTRIGSDEAGKGDYFGPLVAAAVLATQYQADSMRDMGVRDSKLLDRSTVKDLATELRGKTLAQGQWRVVTVPPARYNILMVKMGNLNRVLGWAHARAIEEVLKFREPVSLAVADQFGDPKYVEQALFSRGRNIRLVQMPKGERDVVVAAASILARDGFLSQMEEMSRKYGVEFPRGASHVEDFAKDFAKKFGANSLLETAKVHFATTEKIVDSPQALMETLNEKARNDDR